MAFLKVYAHGEERTVFLGVDRILIGRGQDTDVMLKDPKASRHHCVLEPVRGEYWRVRDLDSGNGTKVNGTKVQAKVLEAGDVVEVGDAKIIFAGEAAAVVDEIPPELAEPEPEAAERERPARRPRRKSGHGAAWIVSVLVLVAAAAVAFVVTRQDKGAQTTVSKEDLAFRAVKNAGSDEELVELAGTFRQHFPESRHLPELDREVAAARKRLREGTSGLAHGFDPKQEVEGLRTLEGIAHLEQMLETATAERRPAIRALMAVLRTRLVEERETFFRQLEGEFSAQVDEGEFARAREIWFFLGEEPDWVPVPEEYIFRIVDANQGLENKASASRGLLFERVGQAEKRGNFAGAEQLLVRALPRFRGTSVERSLDERLEFIRRARAERPRGEQRRPTVPTVHVDVRRKMTAALGGLDRRDFAGVAAQLRALAGELKGKPGFAQVDARAKECEAAAALHAALLEEFLAGRLPKGQIARRWRILRADEKGLRVRVRGKELDYPWPEVPAELYVALLSQQADKREGSELGNAVAAFAVGGTEALLPILAVAYGQEGPRPSLDAFVAARVRDEPVPEGGYAVDAGEIMGRKEYLRRREQALISGYQAQLDKAYAALRNDKAVARLDKLTKKKDQLDEAREHALELIFDEKKYFYPYRGTGRMGEYNKVQQEVNRRIEPVRDLWDDSLSLKVKASPEFEKNLKLFDEAAAELDKRFVDVEEKTYEIGFLRSYFGKKFNIRNFYRTPEEKQLLQYSDEVMEFNAGVEGKITEVEREQVRITNEYRKIFGRWPVRLVEPLVLSSRGHCEDMARQGFFGHFNPTIPDRRTPYQRMKLAGYKYGASENCIMGRTHPKAAHDGWCGSSGHHRNLLMAPWTEMGTGHHGNLMTQNFGRAPKWSKYDPEPEPTPWDDDPGWMDDDYDEPQDESGDTEIEETEPTETEEEDER